MLSTERTTEYKCSPFVRETATADGVVLLDIRRGHCLGMTPMSAKIWDLLKHDRTDDEIVDSLAAQFPTVCKSQLRADITELINDLHQKELLITSESTCPKRFSTAIWSFLYRLLVTPETPGSKKPFFRWLTLKTLFLLLIFDLCGFGTKFGSLYEVIVHWQPLSRPAAPEALDRVCSAVNHACAFYPKKVLCLQRSFVTACLARSCGVAAEMVIGAQTVPFKAHAWVELNGQVVNENPRVQEIYGVWERC